MKFNNLYRWNMEDNKEYKLLRPLPSKVVGQKVRVDDLTAILNINHQSIQSLVEGGWIEEWKDSKSKSIHVSTRNYQYGTSRVSIKVENIDKEYVDTTLSNIESAIKHHPSMYLTRIDLVR